MRKLPAFEGRWDISWKWSHEDRYLYASVRRFLFSRRKEARKGLFVRRVDQRVSAGVVTMSKEDIERSALMRGGFDWLMSAPMRNPFAPKSFEIP